jgi:predicted lipoprotein with Yx(FWY)xxD motif
MEASRCSDGQAGTARSTSADSGHRPTSVQPAAGHVNQQSTVGGRPAYRFQNDQVSGRNEGQGVSGMWIVPGSGG